MSVVLDLYAEKVRRMYDDELADECLFHGRVMEQRACANLLLTPDQKSRAVTAFTEAANRHSMEDEREMLLTALRVLRIL